MHNTVSVLIVSWLKAFELIIIFLISDPVLGGDRKAREVIGNEDY